MTNIKGCAITKRTTTVEYRRWEELMMNPLLDRVQRTINSERQEDIHCMLETLKGPDRWAEADARARMAITGRSNHGNERGHDG